jgi:ATP-dependent 26S proteasome regulatory subunit
LQRVEDFPGLIILASNFKSNIDNAFIRRFNVIVPFFTPTAAERLQLWKSSVPPKAQLADDVDLSCIANKYELTGSSIVSIIHYASLQTIARKSNVIVYSDLLEGIQREYEKEERVFTA